MGAALECALNRLTQRRIELVGAANPAKWR
jgi:hypothetical protein